MTDFFLGPQNGPKWSKMTKYGQKGSKKKSEKNRKKGFSKVGGMGPKALKFSLEMLEHIVAHGDLKSSKGRPKSRQKVVQKVGEGRPERRQKSAENSKKSIKKSTKVDPKSTKVEQKST